MNSRTLLLLCLTSICFAQAQNVANPENIISFKGQQVTGVTVSAKGRIFANFPDGEKQLPTQ